MYVVVVDGRQRFTLLVVRLGEKKNCGTSGIWFVAYSYVRTYIHNSAFHAYGTLWGYFVGGPSLPARRPAKERLQEALVAQFSFTQSAHRRAPQRHNCTQRRFF